jgi:hypothetical protein
MTSLSGRALAGLNTAGLLPSQFFSEQPGLGTAQHCLTTYENRPPLGLAPPLEIPKDLSLIFSPTRGLHSRSLEATGNPPLQVKSPGVGYPRDYHPEALSTKALGNLWVSTLSQGLLPLAHRSWTTLSFHQVLDNPELPPSWLKICELW